MRPSPMQKKPAQGKTIGRAARYLIRYPFEAILPYTFLVIATLAQLAVPHMVSNAIDAVTGGVTAKFLLSQMPAIPQAVIGQALPRILAFLKLPPEWTIDQLTLHLLTTRDSALRSILLAGLSIVGLAAVRGLFAFGQAYYAQKNSETIAYDLRNDLYAKIQNLSFSYHDRNSTGQLMIRATDDVEKVRLFIGQGLLQLVGAVLLLAGTLIILFTTNSSLALVTLWILPVAVGLFVVFGIVSRPLFDRVQQKLSALNTTLQENMAGIRVVKAFTREKSEQAKFNVQADRLMNQQLVIARLFTTLFPLTFLIANLGQASVLFAGGNQIIHGTLSLGEWQGFSPYPISLFLPGAPMGATLTPLQGSTFQE